MEYPTEKEIQDATQLQLCGWYRSLPSPATPEETGLMDAIIRRWRDGGRFTPEISKALGFEGAN